MKQIDDFFFLSVADCEETDTDIYDYNIGWPVKGVSMGKRCHEICLADPKCKAWVLVSAAYIFIPNHCYKKSIDFYENKYSKGGMTAGPRLCKKGT